MDDLDNDRFAPLTESELVRDSGCGGAPPHNGWKAIVPIPDGVRLPDLLVKKCCPSGYSIRSAWRYRTPTGGVPGFVVRYDEPGTDRKEFKPFTYCESAAGKREWRCRGMPEPRPLFNLDLLAAKPDAPVLVSEGEKSAARAARIFPESVCLTSAGGSQAAAKTDWSPLAGRRAMIWPDADVAGSKYADAVAAILHGHGCEVSIIDAVALASMAPGGGQREPGTGWDAADAVAEWQDTAALRKAAHGLAKPYEAEAANPGPGADGPLPLFPPLAEAEPYPADALGKTLSRAANAIASKAQVPIAMAAQSVLAVASLAASSHADVQLPFGQVRPLSLFFATVAASGDRKTTADNEALWPVAKREKTLREAYADELKEWRIDFAAWSAEKRKIEANSKSGLADRKSSLASLGGEPEKPLSPFLVSGDLTIEGLTKNWPNAHAALGVFTAEGGTFTAGHGMNEDNRLKTAAMLSELWDGKPIKRVRALDGVTILPGRRLSLHVMIQPDAAAGFLCNDVLRDQGLLSRILVAAPASLAGSRAYQEPCPQAAATIKAYGARLLSILEAEPALEHGTRNELAQRALPISAAATGIWRKFYDHIEGQCGAGNGLEAIGDFAAKAAELAARIAGVVTIVEDLHAREIGRDAMEGAVGLAEWYVCEALRLKQAGRTDPKLLRAAKLLEWLQSQPDGKASFRGIIQFGPNAMRTKVSIEEALAILAGHGWITEVSARPRTIKAVTQ